MTNGRLFERKYTWNDDDIVMIDKNGTQVSGKPITQKQIDAILKRKLDYAKKRKKPNDR